MLSLLTLLTVQHVAYSHPVKLNTAGCPLEHYRGVRAVNSKPHYAIDEEIVFECEEPLTENTEDIYYIHFKDELVVFPSLKRKCQANYTWSGVPPICVWKNILRREAPEKLGIRPSNSVYCADNAICMEALKKWPTDAHTSQANYSQKNHEEIKTENTEKFEYQEFLFNFPRHFHFIYMVFEQPSNREFIVDVRARNFDKIEEFSEDASEFSTSYYKAISDKKYALIPLNLYSEQIMVKFSTEKTKETRSKPGIFECDWKPRPIFYPFPEFNFTRTKDNLSFGCPERPEIANAEVYTLINRSKMTYVCRRGFVMVDPVTKELSNGTIECSNDFEWTPNPFPVCLPFSSTPNNGDSGNVQTANLHPDSSTIPERNPTQDTGIFANKPSNATIANSPRTLKRKENNKSFSATRSDTTRSNPTSTSAKTNRNIGKNAPSSVSKKPLLLMHGPTTVNLGISEHQKDPTTKETEAQDDRDKDAPPAADNGVMWLAQLLTSFSKTEAYNQNRSQLQAIHQPSFKNGVDDGGVSGRTWEVGIFVAAVLAGVALGVAALSIFLFLQKMRRQKKQSKSHAERIEERHRACNERVTREDSQGYMTPISAPSERDMIGFEDHFEDYITPITHLQVTRLTEENRNPDNHVRRIKSMLLRRQSSTLMEPFHPSNSNHSRDHGEYDDPLPDDDAKHIYWQIN